MSAPLLTLPALPEPDDFYKNYWNKKPFVVRSGVPASILDGLIGADELAGLSLEEDIRSRIVQTEGWACEHGPFEDDKFSNLGEENWSLLVQDVEKYHPPTAKIIELFGFSPCWLIDDVMVSYSTPGGGVGPHLDSYHVFLIQSTGKRRWKIGRDAILDEKYIADIDLKILADDFLGDEIEVGIGDVLYLPPYFPHAGVTTQESLTYSIGFLGPSLAELLVEFGHYIEEQGKINTRYDGNKLDGTSAGENLSEKELNNFRNMLTSAINEQEFEDWLKGYFSNSI